MEMEPPRTSTYLSRPLCSISPKISWNRARKSDPKLLVGEDCGEVGCRACCDLPRPWTCLSSRLAATTRLGPAGFTLEQPKVIAATALPCRAHGHTVEFSVQRRNTQHFRTCILVHGLEVTSPRLSCVVCSLLLMDTRTWC